MRNDISKLQCAAGLTLQQICTILHLSREDFSDVLARFLSAGKEKDARKEDGKDGKKSEGIAGATVLGYFQKLPQKYLVPQEGFDVFCMCIENAIDVLCRGEGPCIIDAKTVSDNWGKRGEEILQLLDEIHKRAVEIQTEAISHENQKKIADLLST